MKELAKAQQRLLKGESRPGSSKGGTNSPQPPKQTPTSTTTTSLMGANFSQPSSFPPDVHASLPFPTNTTASINTLPTTTTPSTLPKEEDFLKGMTW